MIGLLPVRDAEQLRTRLERQGIAVALAFNHVTCTTGCSPSQEVWAHPEDVAEIEGLLKAAHVKMITDMGLDPEVLAQVFDPEKEKAVCPACATEFSTTLSECPDCGLGFGG